MYPSKKTNNGWILCPSKSFPGKFYYFNGATGETAWCLNENERKLLKNPQIQKADLQHCYPEPCSPPAEEPTISNQQPIRSSPYQERPVSNYSQDVPYQDVPKNLNTYMVQPYDQFANSVPCQIPIPMIWPSDGNMPQVVMIVMNHAMRRLAIEDPRQGFRHPHQATEPNRVWMDPNRVWAQTNQTWNEPNQFPIAPNRSDRDIVIHSGEMPLSERFKNYKKPDVEDKKVLKPNQFDLSTKNQCNSSNQKQYQSATNKSTKASNEQIIGLNQSLNRPGPSKIKHDSHKQNNSMCNPFYSFAKDGTQHSNSRFNFEQSPKNMDSNSSTFIPSTSNSVLSTKNIPNSSQNISKYSQELFGQSQTNKELFGQNQINKELFGQSQTNKKLFGQSHANEKLSSLYQTGKQIFGQNFTNKGLFRQDHVLRQSQSNQELFRQNATNKVIFGKSLTNKNLFGQSNTNENMGKNQRNRELLGQSQTNKEIFEQSQTNQQPFRSSHNCPEIFQTSSFEQNPFQKLITEKSTPNQSAKVDFPKSTQSNLELPKCQEHVNHDTNVKENTVLTPDNKLQNSQETSIENLDKHDLRRILMEKKRKSNVSEPTDAVGAKKYKTSMKDTTVATSKKKVTFNLNPECYLDSGNRDDSYKELENDEELPSNSESWYVVADAKTLLEDFDVLNNFVKSDPKCNLTIPSQVMSDIVAMSRGECFDRNSVTLARHLLRGLDTPQPHINIQQSKDVSLDITTDDSIINCCLEIMDNAYVALVTSDEELQTTAEYLSINSITCEQIKYGQDNQPKLHFNVKKVKISITNDQNIEMPIEKLENLSFGTDNRAKKISSPKGLGNPIHSNTTELNHNTIDKDLQNSKVNRFAFEIKKDPRIYDTTTLKERSNVSFSKEATFPVLNNGMDANKRNIDSENQPQNMSTYFHSENEAESVSSIYRQANGKMQSKSISEIDNDKSVSKKGSIFKINGIETLQSQKEGPLSNSIFKSNWQSTTHMQFSNFEAKEFQSKEASQRSIFDKEKYENRASLSKPVGFGNEEQSTIKEGQSTSVFDMESYKNRGKQSGSSILDGKSNEYQRKEDQSKSVSEKEENVANVKNKNLEQFLKRFYEKNRMYEHLIEGRKTELDCSFKQILEECLNEILRNKINDIKQNVKSSPPWTLSEALQCIVVVYSNHTYIRDVVSVFTSVLNAKVDLPAKDIIRVVGCGAALVKYLKFIAPTTEVLQETEDALNMVLHNLSVDVDLEPRTQAFNAADIGGVQRNKRNFIKKRSDVVDYLKKHFAAWADYDETLEENTSMTTWGKNYKDTMIVRTCGKNLGLLKLNNQRAMTMEQDSSQYIDENKKSDQNKLENISCIDNFEKNRTTEDMDVENINSDGIFDKENLKNLKLTRIVENATAKMLDNTHDQKLKSIEETQKIEKKAEPKVVRLFSNIDLTKELTNKKSLKKPDFDDFSTHGHTFGAKEQNGTKILRNIKPIKEFEEKFKLERKPVDLDEMDYSVISKSDENNNLASESTNTNNNCLSMSLQGNDIPGHKRYEDTKNCRDVKNDCFDATNDRLYATNDTHNFNSNRNSISTNNESHSMSLDKCITNNIYGSFDLDEILPINYINKSTIDRNVESDFNSNFVSYETNYNYDIDVMNDDFKRLNQVSLGNDDTINDMIVVKDDSTNDSGYDNVSQQAYYVMDTFLCELKVAFKAMHTFLGNSVRELGSDPFLTSEKHIRDAAMTTHAHLNKIMDNLNRIIQRETSSGPKLKKLVDGAGSLAETDYRVNNYREILTKCYKHARQLDHALKAMLTITNGQRR